MAAALFFLCLLHDKFLRYTKPKPPQTLHTKGSPHTKCGILYSLLLPESDLCRAGVIGRQNCRLYFFVLFGT